MGKQSQIESKLLVWALDVAKMLLGTPVSGIRMPGF